jgi:hypothetical protein
MVAFLPCGGKATVYISFNPVTVKNKTYKEMCKVLRQPLPGSSHYIDFTPEITNGGDETLMTGTCLSSMGRGWGDYDCVIRVFE